MNSAAPPANAPAREISISEGRVVRLTGELGRGERATVYSGQVAGTAGGEIHVAVKIFERLSHVSRHATVQRLSRALQAQTSSVHPGIVEIYEYDFSRLQPFVVCELVDGCTVAALLEKERMPRELAVCIALAVGETLDGALRTTTIEGIPFPLVHGHLSAREILLSWSGDVKVADFGVVAATMGASDGRSPARLAPVAPEVHAGELPDERSDVFSLGVLLRDMLVGRRFAPDTTPEDAGALARAGAMAPGLPEDGIPPLLRSVLRRATNPDARRRFADAGEFVSALRSVAEESCVEPTPDLITAAVEAALEESSVFPRRGSDSAGGTLDDEPSSELDDTQQYRAAKLPLEPPAARPPDSSRTVAWDRPWFPVEKG